MGNAMKAETSMGRNEPDGWYIITKYVLMHVVTYKYMLSLQYLTIFDKYSVWFMVGELS